MNELLASSGRLPLFIQILKKVEFQIIKLPTNHVNSKILTPNIPLLILKSEISTRLLTAQLQSSFRLETAK